MFVGFLLLVPAGPAYASCAWNSPLDCLPKVSIGGATIGTNGVDCATPPAPSRPDAGIAGGISSRPDYQLDKPKSFWTEPDRDWQPNSYDVYGYAGLGFDNYDLGCGPSIARDAGAEGYNTLANLLFTPTVWLVAGDNALREIAYDPNKIWGWTNDLVSKASKTLRDRIFTPWGSLALILVGGWLLWGARGGKLSDAVTTAGWAILVMLVVTVVANWPLQSSRLADGAMTGAIDRVATTISGQQVAADDPRTPAQRASARTTDLVLYRTWLRGTLGSDTSSTAKKYGPLLFQAKAISWVEAEDMDRSAADRDRILAQKKALWKDTAAKIKTEDPQAYEYLTGKRGAEKLGSSFVGLFSAMAVTPFDLAANVLILLAFLIMRLAVVFLPVLGAIGLLAPASGPLRKLAMTVVAALFNTVVFGLGSAVYLLCLELIMNTASLAGWQQVFLLWICGLVLWLILRPYRKITQLAGKDPFGELTGGLGRMHRKVFGDLKDIGKAALGSYLGDAAALDQYDDRQHRRAEAGKGQGRPEMGPGSLAEDPRDPALPPGTSDPDSEPPLYVRATRLGSEPGESAGSAPALASGTGGTGDTAAELNEAVTERRLATELPLTTRELRRLNGSLADANRRPALGSAGPMISGQVLSGEVLTASGQPLKEQSYSAPVVIDGRAVHPMWTPDNGWHTLSQQTAMMERDTAVDQRAAVEIQRQNGERFADGAEKFAQAAAQR
jgi:hypothetical protein